MKLLIITPSIPYPPYRGDKLRMFNICKILAQNHEVKVLTFQRNKDEDEYIKKLSEYGIDTETIWLSKLRSYLNLYRSFFTKYPLQVAYCYSKKMQKRICELTKKDNFDIAYFHLIISAQYGKSVCNESTVKVIDFTDSTSLYLKRHIKNVGSSIKTLPHKFEKYKVYNYENKCKEFDTLFICSNVDKTYLEERSIHDNIKLFLNGFDPNEFKANEQAVEKNRIIFSGNMPYLPNRKGVAYFVDEIFPLVLKEKPDAKFYIVGQNPPEEIQNLQSENIIVTGFVEDIKAEYLKSTVNVAPIKFGAGTPNKITEALALGVPTVSTSLAVAGLPDNLKKYISIADSPKDFASAIIRIMDDPSIRNSLLDTGKNEIYDTLSMENVVNNIVAYLKTRIN